MKIVNRYGEDNHMHSFNFSDGLHTIDEIVQYVGKLWFKEISITDHSQAQLDAYNDPKKMARINIKRWENVFNDVKVRFGIEGDLLNEKGDICDHIQNKKSDFLILSTHTSSYTGVPHWITEGYIKAIKNNYQQINCIGHLCRLHKFHEHIDVVKITDIANKYNIPLELNGLNLVRGRTDLSKLDIMLKNAKYVMVNSDAHSLAELKNVKEAYRYLKDKGHV